MSEVVTIILLHILGVIILAGVCLVYYGISNLINIRTKETELWQEWDEYWKRADADSITYTKRYNGESDD